MAVRVADEFGARANPPDASYPDGSLKDETNPGVSNDGSPLSSRVGNDFQGFMQSALAEAGIDANGNPDSVENPQILNAIKSITDDRFNYDGLVYEGVGNISDFAGQQLQEADKTNAYQYPDNSRNFYAADKSQAFPIAIPSDPSSSSNWSLVNSAPLKSLDELSSGVLPKKSDIYDVFIIYGQSNAVGYASNTDGYPENLSEAKFFDSSNGKVWSLKKGMRYSSGNVSSGHAWQSFANEYYRIVGRKCLFIPCAKGESSIQELSKGGDTYTKMASAIADFNSLGLQTGNYSLLFHQGETDMLNETAHNLYIQLLDVLLRDIRSDFGVNKTYVFRCGCPQNRKEGTWYAIQSAQDYICQSYDWAVMPYSGCGSFTLGNGLLREGVHYTQKGYNVMGHEAAKSVADNVLNVSPYSEDERQTYGRVLTTPDQIWRHTYARCLFEGGAYTILDKDSVGDSYRAVNVLVSEVVGDKLRVHIQSRADYAIELQASVNSSAYDYGFECVPSLVSTGVNTYAIDIEFFKNLSFMISMDTGSVAFAPTGSSDSPWKDLITVDNLGSKTYRVNHPYTRSFPSIGTMYSDSITDENVKPIFMINNYTSSFQVKTFSASGAKAVCNLNRARIPASNLVDGMQVEIVAKVAAKKL